MIRHRPNGSGHPYSIDTDQRWPVDPVAGEPLLLGVRTSGTPARVVLELSEEGHEPRVLAMTSGTRAARGRVDVEGHLAAAQAGLAPTPGGWLVTVTDLQPHRRYRYRFTSVEQDGRERHTRWFDFRVSAWRDAGGAVSVTGTDRVLAGSVQALDDGERVRRVRCALPLNAHEHVTGFGERFDAVDQRGRTLDSIVFEQYKNQGEAGKTYLPMPFAHVVGGSGWGFHVQTSRRVWFDVGKSDADRICIEAEVDTQSTNPSLLSIAVYDGRPAQVLAAFLDDVGRLEELPDWVFRLWASSNEWNTQAEVMRQVALHRHHDIPCGSVVIEAWSDESTFTIWRDAQYAIAEDGAPMRYEDFTFPAEGAWPDPKGMVDELHDQGIRLHLWQIPLLKMRPHPTGQAQADAQAAVRQGRVVLEEAPGGSLRPYRNRGWWFPLALMPDLTDEQAAAWWTDKRRYLVEDVGIDGFKTDGGEHAWGRDVRYLDGTYGDEGNSRFPVHYAKAFGDLLRSAGKPAVTFSRAGFTGSQAHGAFWAGDENSTWQAFRWSMHAGLSAAACGILYWGWDIAGFSGDVPDGELYLRSAAAAAFVPIMQYHSEFNHHRTPSRDRTPWNIAERTGDDRVIPVFRRFAQLRERLLPYLAASARASLTTAAPLMRPLYFDHPTDVNVWDWPIQWTLGDDVLVAPVLEQGATSWDCYLPQGDWVDAFTGEPVVGGGVTRRGAPIDEIPAYVRAAKWPGLRDVFLASD